MFAAPVTPKTDKDKELATAQAFAELPATIKSFQDVMQTMASSIDTINTSIGHLNTTVSDFAEKQNEVETSLKSVQDNLDNTPEDNYTQRPAATGSSDYVKSDC